MNKKRLGEIEKDMPGYMYAKWQNSLEKVGGCLGICLRSGRIRWRRYEYF